MKKTVLAAISLALALCACSSMPERAMSFDSVYQKAAARYESANNALSSGDVAAAGQHLFMAYNLANSIDNAELLAKICLSAASYKMASGSENALLVEEDGGQPSKRRKSEAEVLFERKTAQNFLAEARDYASWAQNELLLAAVSIYRVKAELHDGRTDFSAYAKLLAGAEEAVFADKDKFFAGYLRRTQGDLAFAQRKYAEAAESYMQAAQLHTESRYLYETSMDWYYAARAYNYAGKKAEAVDAIMTALQFDRDAENSAAIAADYRAYAKILQRGNPTPEERKKAEAALRRASEIDMAREAAGN